MLWMWLLLAMWPASIPLRVLLHQWLKRFEPWPGIVAFALLAGTMVVCIIGIEVLRRRPNRILPGPDRD